MKKTTMHASKLIAVAVLGMSAVASFSPQAFAKKDAAQTQARKERKERRGDKARGGVNMKMMKQLDLSETQQAQIKTIMDQAKVDTKAVRDDATLTPEAKRTRTREIRAAAQTQVEALLTPAQRTEMEQAKKQRGNRAMEKMAKTLGLSAEQNAQLQPILQNARQQREAVEANTALTPAQKKQQLKAIAEAAQNQFDAILTTAQRQQMDAIKEQQKEKRAARKANGNAKNKADKADKDAANDAN